MDWLWRSRPRRPITPAGIVFLIVFLVVFTPLLDCPCEGRTRFVVLPGSTDDEARFTMTSCAYCRGKGRVTLFDRLFDGAAPPPRSP